MTMTFKEALIAHLQGEKVQCMGCEGTWKPLMEKIGEGLIRYVDTQSYMSGCSFRIKPNTILVNGVEVPAPESEPLQWMQKYYIPDPINNGTLRQSWQDNASHLSVLKRGLVYLTHEDAWKRTEAMIITQEVK